MKKKLHAFLDFPSLYSRPIQKRFFSFIYHTMHRIKLQYINMALNMAIICEGDKECDSMVKSCIYKQFRYRCCVLTVGGKY